MFPADRCSTPKNLDMSEIVTFYVDNVPRVSGIDREMGELGFSKFPSRLRATSQGPINVSAMSSRRSDGFKRTPNIGRSSFSLVQCTILTYSLSSLMTLSDGFTLSSQPRTSNRG